MAHIPPMLAFLALVVIAAKASDLKDVAERTQMKMCRGIVSYRVEVTFNWSGMTHPRAYPENGHFSPLVVASHNKFYTMWAPGMFSNLGIQTIGETGNPMPQLEELEMERNVLRKNVAKGPTLDGTKIVTVSTTLKGYGGFTYVSAAAMLAPSPDWFTGFWSENLCDMKIGRWKSLVTGDLTPWDAGTDMGTQFLSPDEPADPKRPIRSLLMSRFMGTPVGTYKIIRLS